MKKLLILFLSSVFIFTGCSEEDAKSGATPEDYYDLVTTDVDAKFELIIDYQMIRNYEENEQDEFIAKMQGLEYTVSDDIDEDIRLIMFTNLAGEINDAGVLENVGDYGVDGNNLGYYTYREVIDSGVEAGVNIGYDYFEESEVILYILVDGGEKYLSFKYEADTGEFLIFDDNYEIIELDEMSEDIKDIYYKYVVASLEVFEKSFKELDVIVN